MLSLPQAFYRWRHASSFLSITGAKSPHLFAPCREGKLKLARSARALQQRPRATLWCAAAMSPQIKTSTLLDELKVVYKKKIMPLEAAYSYDAFYSPLLTDTEIGAKPMVLLLGQYSTGKTTFIRHLLGREYPGARIGPEPTVCSFWRRPALHRRRHSYRAGRADGGTLTGSAPAALF